jgi:hypothetical protein
MNGTLISKDFFSGAIIEACTIEKNRKQHNISASVS